MPYALNLFHDQVGAGGSSARPLPAARRMLYVRHGRATINGRTINADEAIYCGEPVTMQASTDWSQVWRWEIALPNTAPSLLEGTNILSSLRMSRVITHMPLLEGSRWLFRLDQITSAAGRMADRHQHPGPGIRCLLEGTFNVQSVESARDLMPGDAWYETGPDTVVAWGSLQMVSKFMRGMILPIEWEGKPTSTWLSGEPSTLRPGIWKVYIDRIVVI